MASNVTIELLRLIGSLERISLDEKGIAGEAILQALQRKKLETMHGSLLWTLGRIGCRVPVYASLQQMVGIHRAQIWVEKLLASPSAWIEANLPMFSLCLMQLTRRTNDRYRDQSQATRDKAIELLRHHSAPNLHISLIDVGGSLDQESSESIVGESLPLGFRLSSKVKS